VLFQGRCMLPPVLPHPFAPPFHMSSAWWAPPGRPPPRQCTGPQSSGTQTRAAHVSGQYMHTSQPGKHGVQQPQVYLHL
jgi:hypothetical protein